jgi:hypothetical protein
MCTVQGEPGAMTLLTLCAELLLQRTELLQTENKNKKLTVIKNLIIQITILLRYSPCVILVWF